jgi:hypothetical protein
MDEVEPDTTGFLPILAVAEVSPLSLEQPNNKSNILLL